MAKLLVMPLRQHRCPFRPQALLSAKRHFSSHPWDLRSWIPWTQSELTQLEELDAKGATSRDIALQLGRTHDAVKYRKSLLRIGHSKPASTNAVSWTKEDADLARKMYHEGKSTQQIHEAMPNRTLEAINSYCYRNFKRSGDHQTPIKKSNPWTREEDQLLVQLRDVERLTFRQIQAQMNRGIPALENHYRLITQLEKPELPEPWSKEDVSTVLQLAGTGITYKAIGSQLSFPRSASAVGNMIRRLKWNTPSRTSTTKRIANWSKEEDERLYSMKTSPGTSQTEITAAFSGRTHLALATRWRLLRLRAARRKETSISDDGSDTRKSKHGMRKFIRDLMGSSKYLLEVCLSNLHAIVKEESEKQAVVGPHD